MDHLKEGIGLRGYAQQDPLVAYKKESFDMFEAMMTRFQEDTLRNLFRMQILSPNGTPIESLEQLAALQAEAATPVAPPPPQLPQAPAATRLSGGGTQEQTAQSPKPVEAPPASKGVRSGSSMLRSRLPRGRSRSAAARGEIEIFPSDVNACGLCEDFIQQYLGLGGQGTRLHPRLTSAMHRQPV